MFPLQLNIHDMYYVSKSYLCLLPLQLYWDVPDTEAFREYCLHRVQDRWKDFKHRLGQEYIFGGARMGQNPCDTYQNIDPATWEKFKRYRLSKEFQVYL